MQCQKRRVSSEGLKKLRKSGLNLWLKKARDRHGNKYSYDTVEQTFETQKRPSVKITCKKHKRSFFVIPHNHLRFKSGGCEACDYDITHQNSINREREKFFTFFTKHLADRLVIRSEFKGMTKPLNFYCKIHQEISSHKPTFLINSNNFGCNLCASSSVL